MNQSPYADYTLRRAATRQRRQLATTRLLPQGRAERDGQTLLNFAGNDYLGLSQHPRLIAAAQDYAARYGAGATASRLVVGNLPTYAAIEQRLAAGKRAEAALVFASGYQANLSILAALADPEVVGRPVVVFADRLSHHSLLQGALLGGARLIRFQHNDCDHLGRLLRRYADHQALIVSESVFGMDGDCADLAQLATLAEQHNAMLYVDEAHATGLFGPDGFGHCAAYPGKIDVAMGTFGKALGSFGAYVACSVTLRDYLLQRCGGLIYSTALPPSTLGSIEVALKLLPQLTEARRHVQTQAQRLREALQAQGWNTGLSSTQIVPVLLGDESATLTLAEALRKRGILVPAIRPPTVPRGSSRLRFSLSAAHDATTIDQLIATMADLHSSLVFAT